MEKILTVGQSCEVAVIINNSAYPSLYSNGNTGVVLDEYLSGNAKMTVGHYNDYDKNCTWAVRAGCYKKIGKLTVTKVK